MNQKTLGPGGARFSQQIRSMFSGSIVAYWPLWDTSGTTVTEIVNGRNGTYVGSPTLGQPGIGDGRTSVKSNGTSQYANVQTAATAAAFNGAAGSMMCWFKMASASVWTDGLGHQLFMLYADASNLARFRKDTVNNQVSFLYSAGAVTKTVTVGSQSSTDWVHVALTWSKANDRMKAYINGAQAGATQTTLGVWAGALTITTVLAGDTVPSLVFSGWAAHAILLNTEATAAQIQAAATV